MNIIEKIYIFAVLLKLKCLPAGRQGGIAQVAELVDAPDSKSGSSECGFDSRLEYNKNP